MVFSKSFLELTVCLCGFSVPGSKFSLCHEDSVRIDHVCGISVKVTISGKDQAELNSLEEELSIVIPALEDKWTSYGASMA